MFSCPACLDTTNPFPDYLRNAMTHVCPKCDVALFIVHLRDIEVDYCERCRGIWLDAGELEALLEDANDPVLKLLEQPGSIPTGNKHLCPRCDALLHEIEIRMPNQPVLFLDRCPRNHGLWFDGDELPQLLARIPTAPGAVKTIAFLREIFAAKPTT
jgi:Zn-finger nucleic acid-binding protein